MEPFKKVLNQMRFVRVLLLAFCNISLFPNLLIGQSQKPKVESSFQPATITIAQSTIYKIVIHGSQEDAQGTMPTVAGLSISNSPQTFRSASFINGVPSVRLEMSFQVKPTSIGKHTIPSWSIRVGSNTIQVPPTTLSVLTPNQQDKISQTAEEKNQNDLKQASFIEFRNPRPYLYEGETVSTQIDLYIWDRLPVSRIERVPQKEGAAFSITELGQPKEKRNQTKFNKTYTIFSWPVGLTAAIAGSHNIKFSTSIRVRVKSRGNSPFNSPFFNDPFFGFGREESITVESAVETLEIRKLPIIERPDSFRGAIGNFTVRTVPDTDRVSLGDPLRLTFEIEGKGNFSAMPAPELKSNINFKIGPPAFSFEGDQVTKHMGKQSFEYILTPLNPGLIEIPSIPFSYFDPIQEKYFSVNTSPHSLRVDPGEKWIDPTPQIQQKEDNKNFVSTKDLFQTENEPGTWIDNISNETLLNSKLFWSAQSFPLFFLFGLTFYGWKRKQSGRDAFRQKQSLLKKQMKEAISYKDSGLFFRATRERLRLEIGTFYKYQKPSSLSSNELTSLLVKGGNEHQLISDIKEILDTSDNYEFAASGDDSKSLDGIYKKMNKLLKKFK
jgi:hypothetical protein